MSNVIQLKAHPRQLNAVRAAVNERAKATGASDAERRHALGVAFGAMAEGRSTGCAVALGNSDLRPRRFQIAFAPTGPEAA